MNRSFNINKRQSDGRLIGLVLDFSDDSKDLEMDVLKDGFVKKGTLKVSLMNKLKFSIMGKLDQEYNRELQFSNMAVN